MKDNLIQTLSKQTEKGNELLNKVQAVASIQELNNLQIDFESWDRLTSNILKKCFVIDQLYRMFSGVIRLDNVFEDKNSFNSKRKHILEVLPKKLSHLNTAINYTLKAENIDLLPIEDEMLVVGKTKDDKITNMKKLFISHSSKDKSIIKPLIDLIESIGLKEEQIFFSSSSAYGVDLGENIFERLKKELSNEVFALFILSNNFYSSPVCLCEMGAVWINSKKQIPILIPPFSFDEMKGVFPNFLGFKMDDKNELNSFKQQIENYFGLTQIHFSKWEEKREDYLNKIKELIT